MENRCCNVKCNVCECVHNDNCNRCNLSTIEISHEQTGANVMDAPHYCKSFCQR
ncbi:MAG: DUF1540 domain-containing protein [Clostridiales bacterium]|nr:DUF1540 domain-containing protein [Clostridiales bacterium]